MGFIEKRGFGHCDLCKSPYAIKVVKKKKRTYIVHTEKNLAISGPCPMVLQTENWVLAPLAFGWLTCTADQRSLGLQTTYKEPQIFKNQD